MDHQILSLVKWRNISFMYKHCWDVEMFEVMTNKFASRKVSV